jgi:transcriptional regulator with XRE-family HTH domain
MKISNKTKFIFDEERLFYAEIGRRIKEARIKKYNQFTGKQVKISLVTLAAALKTTYQQIAKYESAENRIPLSKLVQISKILKKPLSYFLDDFNGSPDIAIKFNQAFVNAIDKLEDNI